MRQINNEKCYCNTIAKKIYEKLFDRKRISFETFNTAI